MPSEATVSTDVGDIPKSTWAKFVAFCAVFVLLLVVASGACGATGAYGARAAGLSPTVAGGVGVACCVALFACCFLAGK